MAMAIAATAMAMALAMAMAMAMAMATATKEMQDHPLKWYIYASIVFWIGVIVMLYYN
jgi:hypothetical protein